MVQIFLFKGLGFSQLQKCWFSGEKKMLLPDFQTTKFEDSRTKPSSNFPSNYPYFEKDVWSQKLASHFASPKLTVRTWKWMVGRWNLLLGWLIFRCYVSFMKKLLSSHNFTGESFSPCSKLKADLFLLPLDESNHRLPNQHRIIAEDKNTKKY